MSEFLWTRGLQHARPPCPSPTPGVCSIPVHRVDDVIQPSHPLSSPSPLAFNLSQHLGLFKWLSSSHQVSKVLEFQLQHQSFQWIFRTDFLQDGLVGSPCSPRDSQEFSNTFFTTTFLNSRQNDFLDGILQLMVNKALWLIHPHISFSAPQLKSVWRPPLLPKGFPMSFDEI